LSSLSPTSSSPSHWSRAKVPAHGALIKVGLCNVSKNIH
jgi:hypothetical protein